MGFFKKEVELAGNGVAIELPVPPLLLFFANPASDTLEFLGQQPINRLLDLFNTAHVRSLASRRWHPPPALTPPPLLLSLAAAPMLYLVWAALHDISQANSSDYTLEYSVLAIGVPLVALIWRAAFLILTRRGQIGWLGATACLLLLFDLAALSASLNPKYANDSLAASVFRAFSLPLLGYAGLHLFGPPKA